MTSSTPPHLPSNRSRWVVGFAVLWAAVPWGSGRLWAEIRVLAVSGRPPTEILDADEFQRFDPAPVINNLGEVAFLAGPQVDEGQPFPRRTSVWLADAEQVDLVAADESAWQGDHTQPCFSGGSRQEQPTGSFSELVLNDASAVAFLAVGASDFAGARSRGIWQASRNGPRLIAETGGIAPGFGGEQFHTFDGPLAFANDGTVAYYGFAGSVLEGPPGGGLWSTADGSLALAARAGGTAAVGGSELVFAAQSFASPFSDVPVAARGGRTALRGFLDGPSITLEDRPGVWTYDPTNGLQPLARAGEAAPGDGRPFAGFPEPLAINDRGDVTFLAFVRDGARSREEATSAGGFDLSLGIWTARDGEFEPRVRAQDLAPQAGRALFVDFARPLMNGQGEIAVLAAIDGPGVDEHNAIGIWSDGLGPPGELQLVARGGMHAPGTRPEIVFNSFLEPALNNAGQVAFMAGLAGPDVSDAGGNVLGLWGQDQSGRLRLVARTGDLLELADGDVRRIGAIVFASGSGGQDGRPRGLNDRGEIAFRVRFTDGSSAVLLSDVLSVPEPSSWVLMLIVIGLWVGGKGENAERGNRSFALGRRWAYGLCLAWLPLATPVPLAADEPDYLYPDLIPFVREDQPYLQNWLMDFEKNLLLIETGFANVGDGVLQIRVDRASASGGAADVYQRVFIGTDNGSEYEDFPANRSVFHSGHAHFHFNDFSEFQLRAVTIGEDGTLGVGDLVSATVKSSFLIHDSERLPAPEWADAPSYPSFNVGTYQNISAGWFDVYKHQVEGQAIDLAGVERGPHYWLVQVVDPTNVLRETDETNNSFELLIDLHEPESARTHRDGRFVRPGDFFPIVPGDLDFDQHVTLDDWSLFRAGAGADLAGLTDGQSYVFGDLNLDGRHTPADFLAFLAAYEQFNGPQSAADLAAAVPEPTAAAIALASLAGGLLLAAGCAKPPGPREPRRSSS